MEHFNSNLEEADQGSETASKTSGLIFSALQVFEDNTEDKFFSLDVQFNGNGVVLLGTDKFNTPFFMDNNAQHMQAMEKGRAPSNTTGMSASRQRRSHLHGSVDRSQYEGKSLFVFCGYLGSDIGVDRDSPLEGPDGVLLLNSSPSPMSGFPIYITLGTQEVHAGTLYNVGDGNRIYLHHSSMYCGPDEDTGSHVKTPAIYYDMFALALDQVAWVTSTIDADPMSPATYLKMTNRQRMPGLGTTIDVLKRRKETIANDLTASENNLNDLQQRAMEAASQLVSLRRLNQEMQQTDSGIIDVGDIAHPLIDDIFVRKSGEIETIYIASKEVFFKPSSNPDNIEYDTDTGISCGHFLISITLEQMSHPVKFFNRDYRVMAYDGQPMNHPHVFQEGDPCLGSFGSSISSAIADGNIESVIDMAFMFLGQANQDDSAGRHWGKWLARLVDTEIEQAPLETI